MWQKAKTSFWKQLPVEQHDTVCCIGMDERGDLATAVSTSGLPWKLAGRVGDSPILGAGSYVDNEVGGRLRDRRRRADHAHAAPRSPSSSACASGADPTSACTAVLKQILRIAPEVRTNPRMQLAFIALDKRGQVGAAVYRKQKKVFRYALARGTEPPALHEVAPAACDLNWSDHP